MVTSCLIQESKSDCSSRPYAKRAIKLFISPPRVDSSKGPNRVNRVYGLPRKISKTYDFYMFFGPWENHRFWNPCWDKFDISSLPGPNMHTLFCVCVICFSIFTDFVSQLGPRWGPKYHTGGHQVAIKARKDVFWRGLFTDLLFTWI